ncbi:hypothetical protein [Amycolatopsis vancoresmycina]|uniref:Carboxypeptidase regulatory-like domain-containing protein n=1 Tax=Amycolatopsis vancoresmycina DSM 44592 TaxID=1292037 RepID=R1HE32_9PSEU|nr:hypothetical protein [Amycolatopsis vancoresmycina]EOD58686.1 hypothetical protein H480_42860 [Amycolatopsis vancoresmycina DSM 44592]
MTSSEDAVLRRIRDLWSAVDPPPPLLADWALFALEPAGPDIEILKTCGCREPATTRGGERTHSMTFEGTSRTVVLTVTQSAADTIRVDGWLTPPGAVAVELRTADGPRPARSDEQGRFAFDGVARGPVQLVVRDRGTALTPSVVVGT